MKLMKNIMALFLTLTVLAMALPKLFPLKGNRDFSPNYRIPYRLGEDYYLYKMYIESIPKKEKNSIVLLGDSVIWGHFVNRDNTLSGQFNRLEDEKKFYNAGIDGIHPAAMAGLMEYYGDHLRNHKVILGLNLLWLSSPRHDLTGEVNDEINHRSLLNQFSEEIPSYHATVEEKISSIMERNCGFLSWSIHLKKTLFQGESFYRWTMKNPEQSPLAFFSCRRLTHFQPPQVLKGKTAKQNVKWVPLERSYQWSQIKRILQELQTKNNRVFVLLTPYNTDPLSAESLKGYEQLVQGIMKWFKMKDIPIVRPQGLSARDFKDASHTGAKGYEIVARKLLEDRDFREFITQ